MTTMNTRSLNVSHSCFSLLNFTHELDRGAVFIGSLWSPVRDNFNRSVGVVQKILYLSTGR